MKFTSTCVALLLSLLLAGCVVTTAERERLPTGVTLLDSNDGQCSGIVEIEGEPDVSVDEGEEAVVAIDDDEDVQWQCLSDVDADDGELECPDGTSHIRVSRDEDQSEFTLECYGA